MTSTIYTTYSEESDMTFIMEETYGEDRLISLEVKGFYFGRPKDEYTKEYYNELKADLSAEAPEELVETNYGKMPVPEYLDMVSYQNGFDGYEDMVRQGYSISKYAEYTEEIRAKIAKEN